MESLRTAALFFRFAPALGAGTSIRSTDAPSVAGEHVSEGSIRLSRMRKILAGRKNVQPAIIRKNHAYAWFLRMSSESTSGLLHGVSNLEVGRRTSA